MYLGWANQETNTEIWRETSLKRFARNTETLVS